MKKAVAIILTIAVVAALVCVFVSCGESKETGIKAYKAIETTTYSVGDEYKSSDVVIEAELKDGTTIKVTKNLVFVGEDELKLDENGKFTEKGTYTVKVYALEEREDYFIGNWTIKVA
ncbi:MAG: bacterial Ig-like domain-containing protein [Clostridia bacterium]|nr:bacterial Ig-like domain-containing protein [Clostridia bacterium]